MTTALSFVITWLLLTILSLLIDQKRDRLTIEVMKVEEKRIQNECDIAISTATFAANALNYFVENQDKLSEFVIEGCELEVIIEGKAYWFKNENGKLDITHGIPWGQSRGLGKFKN